MSRYARRSALAVFRWPLALAAATLTGLVLGLTGEGVRDLAAWGLVGLAPLTILVALLRRDPTSR